MAGTPVMAQEEADRLFDSLENGGTFVDVKVAEGFEAAEASVTHPNGLPHKLIRVYDTHSGVESQILPVMLPRVMEQRHADGTRQYSRTQTVTPPVGTAYCFLHPDFPDREKVVKFGLGGSRCSRPGPLTTVVHAERHADHRHHDEYQVYKNAIEAEKADLRAEIEKEEREYRRLQTELMQKQIAALDGPAKKAG